MLIPTVFDHIERYKRTKTPFPEKYKPLYEKVCSLPWDEYYYVFKHTNVCPAALVSKDIKLDEEELSNEARQWVGKCIKTIMYTNGFELKLNHKGNQIRQQIKKGVLTSGRCYVKTILAPDA